jgi:hypothetical protein
MGEKIQTFKERNVTVFGTGVIPVAETEKEYN